MQDSTDNINKEFTDQSWLKMQDLLDEHLPVEKPERDWKVPFLLSLTGALLVASLFLGYLYKTNPLIKEVIVEKIIVEKEYITINSPTPTPSTTIVPAHSHRPTDLQSTSDWSKTNNSNQEYNIPSTAVEYKEHSITENLSQEKEPITTLQQLSTISKLNPSLPIGPIDAGLGFEKIEQEREDNKPKRKLLKFDLGLLVSMSTDLQFSGIGIESGVKFPISEKFALNTGLGINAFSGERRILGGQSQPTSLTDVYSQGLNNFKQIYVPLSLDYSVTSAVVVNSGLRLRYTYSEELDSELNKFIQPTPGRRSPINNNDSVFNNTNLGFSAGVKYSFNQHWSILLDSEWGMSNLIDRTQFFGTSELKYELNVISLRTNFTF